MTLNNQHMEGGIGINAYNVSVCVGNEPGCTALHTTATTRMEIRVQQTHNRRETHPGPAGESPLRKPGPGNQVGEVLRKMQSRLLHDAVGLLLKPF